MRRHLTTPVATARSPAGCARRGAAVFRRREPGRHHPAPRHATRARAFFGGQGQQVATGCVTRPRRLRRPARCPGGWPAALLQPSASSSAMLVSTSSRFSARALGGAVAVFQHLPRPSSTAPAGERSSWLALASRLWCERSSASMRRGGTVEAGAQSGRNLVAPLFRHALVQARRHQRLPRPASGRPAAASGAAPPGRHHRPRP